MSMTTSGRNESRYLKAAGLLVLSLVDTPVQVLAQGKLEPSLRVITPTDVPPLTGNQSSYAKNGMSVHRRVVSKPKDGSVSIDVGYNTYKAGVGAESPYAYTKDEFCYFPSGTMEVDSDGVLVIARAGSFMWRPAGAVTSRTKVLTDTVTICAFGPARDDAWGHKLSDADVGKWNGEELTRPRVKFYHFSAFAPTPVAGGPPNGSTVHRRVISRAKDGSQYMEVTHSAYKAGTQLGRSVAAEDQVCWLESGELEVAGESTRTTMRAGQFLHRPVGAVTYSMRAARDAVTVCFLAPAPGA